MAGVEAPHCSQCSNWAVRRIYRRVEGGRGYAPIGWLCRSTGHIRLDEGQPGTAGTITDECNVREVGPALGHECNGSGGIWLVERSDQRLRAINRLPTNIHHHGPSGPSHVR